MVDLKVGELRDWTEGNWTLFRKKKKKNKTSFVFVSFNCKL